MPGFSVNIGDSVVHMDVSYGKMTLKKACKLLSCDKLGYLDWHDLAERTYKSKKVKNIMDKKTGKYVWVVKSKKYEGVKA